MGGLSGLSGMCGLSAVAGRAAVVAPGSESHDSGNSTFVIPSGVTTLRIRAWSRGGNGEGGNLNGGGQGGGGGSHYDSGVISVSPNEGIAFNLDNSGFVLIFSVALSLDVQLTDGAAGGMEGGGQGGNGTINSGPGSISVGETGADGQQVVGGAGGDAAGGGGSGGAGGASFDQDGLAGGDPGGGGGGAGVMSGFSPAGGPGGSKRIIFSWPT